MSKISRFGVIGNPIKHSLSPLIHSQFAQQFAHSIEYKKYPVPLANLQNFIDSFFANDGKGLNVTLPYKQLVIPLLDELSNEAQLANSVNTISINSKGLLVGDTTDGAGLMLDLNRQQLQTHQKNILVIGAGGACQSILLSLLKSGCNVLLLNRTQQNAMDLVKRFSSIGNIQLFDQQATDSNKPMDGVISSISEFNLDLINRLNGVIQPKTFFYDLNYGERAKEFIGFAKQIGATQYSDGLGMLLAQAAKSYEIWQGVLPDISKVKFD